MINKRTLSGILHASGMLHVTGLLQRLFFPFPIIVTGHRVLPEHTDRPRSEIDANALVSGHAISDRELVRRLRFLTLIRSPGDPADLAAGKPKNNCFYLTFDDGYRDNVEVAGPILKQRGISAIIFFIGELLKKPAVLPWWDAWCSKQYQPTPADSNNPGYGELCMQMKRVSKGLLSDSNAVYPQLSGETPLYLSEQEISTIHRDWGFHLGIHSMTHPNLSVVDRETIVSEISACQAMLSGIPGYIPVIAYPFGVYDERVTGYLQHETDIKTGLATGYGESTSPYNIRRINLNSRPFALFAADCTGLLVFIQRMGKLVKSRR